MNTRLPPADVVEAELKQRGRVLRRNLRVAGHNLKRDAADIRGAVHVGASN
ncbi:MAG: hypothetical protein ABW321_32115 [Polyangiales bacterium]